MSAVDLVKMELNAVVLIFSRNSGGVIDSYYWIASLNADPVLAEICEICEISAKDFIFLFVDKKDKFCRKMRSTHAYFLCALLFVIPLQASGRIF